MALSRRLNVNVRIHDPMLHSATLKEIASATRIPGIETYYHGVRVDSIAVVEPKVVTFAYRRGSSRLIRRATTFVYILCGVRVSQ